MGRQSHGIMWLPVIVGMIGGAATIATSVSLWRLAETRTRHRFEKAADRVADMVGDHMRANIALLHGGAGLFSGSEDVTPDEFTRFAARMRVHVDYPGAQGIGFVRRVHSGEEEAAFLALMRRRHGEGFRLTAAGPGGENRTIVEYIEPPDPRNRPSLGWDMESEPVRREALVRARDLGLAAGTGPVTLVQETDQDRQVGFLIFVPVYRGGGVPETPDERRRTIAGYIFSPFRMRDLMAQVFRRGESEGLAFTIADADPQGAPTILYASHEASPLDPGLHRRTSLEIAGRLWTVEASPLLGFRDASAALAAWTTGALGLLFTASVMGITFVQARARAREIHAADLLARSGDRYRSLVAATASIVWTSSPAGDFIEPQPSWEAFTGQPWDTHRARGWLEAIHTADREPLAQAWDHARAARHAFECEGRIWSHAARGFRWFLMRGVPMLAPDGSVSEWVGLVQDTQERRHLEENLLQSRKLESLGRLAGGIAHDFNNLLTAIVGSADLAIMEKGLSPSVREYLRTILAAAERSGVLTGHLLSFARRQVIEPRNVHVNDLVRGLTSILQRLLGENVRFLTSLAEDTGLIRIDPGQFEQVLVNLTTNARDAMPSGGVLTIQTSNAVLDAEYARTHEGVAPGRYVMLLVSDTGVGMDEAVQRHIFEPFFTTKEPGRGTGLGLATCYGIVRQAGGYIWVYSEPGKGSLFRIFLPRADGQAEPLAPPHDDAPGFGTETILLAEDEPMVRQIAAAALRGYGYSVLAAASGEEALSLALAYPDRIDLVVSDVVLPQISGRELADRLRAARPGLRVLYCSGYTDAVISHHGVLDEGIAFLQKPYTPRQLARRVRSLLDTPARIGN